MQRDCNTCRFHQQGQHPVNVVISDDFEEPKLTCADCLDQDLKYYAPKAGTVKPIQLVGELGARAIVSPPTPLKDKFCGPNRDYSEEVKWNKERAAEPEKYNTDVSKGGVKADKGKNRLELLPFLAIEEIGKVMTWATVNKRGPDGKPYPDDNWRLGLSFRRVGGAALRHLFKWMRGIDNDEESGLSHLAHAGCCIVFLLQYVLQGKKYQQFDDRYNEVVEQ